MEVPWAITPEKVRNAIQRIIEIGQPKKLILFGSYVQGTLNRDSDLDVLVVTGENVANCRKESVRIRRALKGISMPMDILVIPESKLNELADTPGLVYKEILAHGEVVYESTE